MTFDYAKTRATAARLLERFGQSCTITRAVLSDFGPSVPLSGNDDPEVYTVTAAVLPMPAASVGMDIDGTLVRTTDKKILIAATGEAPKTADTITTGEGDFRIMRANRLAPSGLAVLFDCVGRK